jgi:hypothetical protein
VPDLIPTSWDKHRDEVRHLLASHKLMNKKF